MTDINKQKFLMELSKLLTFMYEEDRQNALALYSRMFDKAEDEIALLQLLVSPTRQAVIVARAYNAREHKLEVQSHTRESGAAAQGGELPDYVRAINQIHQTAVSQRIIAPDVTSGQFSLFSDDDSGMTETYRYEDAAPAGAVRAPAPSAPVWPQAAPAPAPAPAPAYVPAAAPVQPPVSVPPPAPVQPPVQTPVQAEAPAAFFAPAGEESAAPVSPAPAPAQSQAPAPAAADFVLPEEPAVPEAPEAVPAQGEADMLFPEQPEQTEDLGGYAVPIEEEEFFPAAGEEEKPQPVQRAEVRITPEQPVEEPEYTEEETVRKPRVFLLILYVLLAVPVTLLGILLLLIPTALCLTLAAAVLAAGGLIFAAAFSGFSVLADIMVVLGIALIILAIGVLFLWVFVWFIGGAIFGLVRGAVGLGGRWCFKEVPAV